MELGNQFSGFEHILYDRNIFGTFEIKDKGHLYDFAGWGGYYTNEDVATLILNSIKNEEYISQIGESGLEVLTFRVKTNLNYFGFFQVIVSNKGYIITAHPIKIIEGNKIFGYN